MILTKIHASAKIDACLTIELERLITTSLSKFIITNITIKQNKQSYDCLSFYSSIPIMIHLSFFFSKVNVAVNFSVGALLYVSVML